MQSSLNESQSQPLETKQKLETFLNATQLAKMELTYQILVDLSCINAANHQVQKPESLITVQTINETKNKLLSVYVEKIKAIDEFFSKNERLFYEEKIEQQQAQIEYIQNQQKYFKSEQLHTLQKDLNHYLKSTLSDLHRYIQSVTVRIKHQRYLDNQIQINAYLQRQKQTFDNERHQLERYIRNHDSEVKEKYIEVAKKVCQQKQGEIWRLEEFNKETHKELERVQQKIYELNTTEQQICRENLELSERVLEIKAQQEAKLRQAQKYTQRKQNNQNLPSQNLVSQIMPSRSSQNQQSTLSMAETSDQPSKTSPKCEIASDDLKTQLQAKKMLIMLIMIMSTIISLW